MVTPGMRACAQARKMAQRNPLPTKNFFVLMQRGFEAEPIAVYSCVLSAIGCGFAYFGPKMKKFERVQEWEDAQNGTGQIRMKDY
mmetsp:Transcript_4117/g.8422  ORF Transcript_4117/g.8422 Transcript_4117/m.8422 type:complete len:85 (-) Transcript_4117:789-1043(-)